MVQGLKAQGLDVILLHRTLHQVSQGDGTWGGIPAHSQVYIAMSYRTCTVSAGLLRYTVWQVRVWQAAPSAGTGSPQAPSPAHCTLVTTPAPMLPAECLNKQPIRS